MVTELKQSFGCQPDRCGYWAMLKWLSGLGGVNTSITTPLKPECALKGQRMVVAGVYTRLKWFLVGQQPSKQIEGDNLRLVCAG